MDRKNIDDLLTRKSEIIQAICGKLSPKLKKNITRKIQ